MNPDFKYIERDLEAVLRKHLNKGKVIVLYGARQVGKTTLLKNLFPEKGRALYIACEQPRIQSQLIPDALVLKRVIGAYSTVVFDEAQYLDNPGLILKVLVDNFPRKNIIASGSSSFDLSNKVSEPLTGRHFKFLLFPLSLREIYRQVSPLDRQFHLEQALIYGAYPEIFTTDSAEEKMMSLQTLADAYLYKDILSFHRVKSSQKVRELLIALALQTGSEVSYSELANTIGADRKTVEHYLDLLEKSFVIFRLYGFSRNMRSEINRKVKIYFYDTGIRNTIINNFNPLSMRADSGGLFESFVAAEMLKREAGESQKSTFYFWRTYEQKEVDLVSDKNGVITAYEVKLKAPKKTPGFSAFLKAYPGAETLLITAENLLQHP
ncbi:MAG: ATP-binding protein [Candidatus Eremiobacteraeota bacterium]|nr:ATP-binding protein [Candidatus Eremiobacteraeota bacterium]